MLTWLQSKATGLLLVALLLVGGFAALAYFKLQLTTKDLALKTELLAVEKDKYQALEGSYTQYRIDALAGKQELEKILAAIQSSKQETANAIRKLSLYPATPILDTPFPDDYLRLLRTGSTDVPTAGAPAGSNK